MCERKKRRVKQNLLLKTLPPLLAILLQSATAFPQSRGLEQQFQKAQELETQGRLDEAAKTYQEILKTDPKNPPVLSALGSCWRAKSDMLKQCAAIGKLWPSNPGTSPRSSIWDCPTSRWENSGPPSLP